MTKLFPLSIFTTVLLTLTTSADIVGTWDTEDSVSQVEIFKREGLWHGKIISLKEPLIPEGEPGAGNPKTDKNNPDPAKQKNPVIGLELIQNFSKKSDKEWTGGTIYDPKNGKTYKCKITKQKNGNLKVRGFIGVSLIGRTTIWKPVEIEK